MRYFGRVYGSRIGITTVRTYSCKQPVHSDPPCVPPNTKCFVVEDKCGAARDYLTNKIPLDKHMVEAQKRTKDGEFEPPCCVSRMVFPPPEKFKPSVTKPKERPPFRSMWEPKCEAKEQFYCKKMLPRFDEMFYHPSDKKRAFQRTWTECPPIKERLKKVCCLDAIEPPEIQRRVKERCPAVTCTFDYVQMRHVCKKTDPDQNNKCRKIHWPCCKPARCPPYCHRVRKLNKCLRLRAPHKSFSETRQWQRPLRERECNRVPPSICEILREGLHQKQFKLKSECPTG